MRDSVWYDGRYDGLKDPAPTTTTFTSFIRGDIATFIHGGFYTDWEESAADLRERFRTAVEVREDQYDDLWKMVAWLEREFGPSARTNFRVRGDSDRAFNAAIGSVVEMKASRLPIEGHAWLHGYSYIECDWSCRWVYEPSAFLFAREEDAVAFKLAFM